MGPKNEMSTRTVLPVKELSWIDRMYQKLENICVEVDKNPFLLFQETSKYMENQMNAVGTNVRKLCTDLIEDLLPRPEVAVKKSESAVFCNCASEKPKQKPGSKSCNITDTRTEDVLENDKDKGCKAGISVPEEHSSLGQTATHIENRRNVFGFESEESRLGEVATQRKGNGKEVECEGHINSVEETAMWSEVARNEGDMMSKRCLEKCISCHKAQQPVEDAHMAAEQGMDGARCDPKPTTGSIAGNLAGYYKEGEQVVDSGFLVVQEVEEQEQTAHWFVNEDQRKIYTLENSMSSLSLDPFDRDPQAHGLIEDFESDWELM